MPQTKHKYRVSIYLGKELYQDLEDMSKVLGIPISTMAKIILNTGFELSKTLESQIMKGGDLNGK